MLFKNKTIITIKYTLTNEDNDKKRTLFQDREKEGKSVAEIRDELLKEHAH